MQEQILQLQMQVAELTQIINSMRNSSSIPFDIGAAFTERLGAGVQFGVPVGTTYGKSVNESGAATYTVSNVMSGTIPTSVGGTTIYIPFYV